VIFLDRRVTDGVVDKWLKAGVLEEGLLRHTIRTMTNVPIFPTFAIPARSSKIPT
jgi:hypothetical protein